MIGKIYSIPIQGRRDNLPHMQIVIATAGKNNLVIPAFGSGGTELEETLKAFEKNKGCFRHQCSIEIDNSKHVTFYGRKTGKLAVWFVGRRNVLSTTEISKHPLDGEMDAAGFRLIVECVLEWNRAKPDDLPPNIVKAVEAVLSEIKAGK